MKKSILTIVFCLITMLVMAQIKVTGTVTDASGKNVQGVIVTQKGTENGVITDAQGRYELQVPSENSVLEFLMIGVDRVEKKCNGKMPLNVQLNGTVSAENTTNKDLSTITLYDRYGKIVAKKENVVLEKGKPNFGDFMYETEFNKLDPATYFYLVQKGKEQKTGYLKKKVGETWKDLGLGRIYATWFTGYNFAKTKVYLDIDGKKTLLKDGIEVDGMKIKLKKRKLKIDGEIVYKKKASLWIGGKEWHLDGISNAGFCKTIDISSEKGNETFMLLERKINKSFEIQLVKKDGKGKTEGVLYVIDGVPTLNKKATKEISPDSIKSITVLKDKSATAIYGELGKNGVIIITTKNKTNSIHKCVSSVNSLNKPLVVVDGKLFACDINSIDPNNIESCTILKDKSATALYGAKGVKNGVIMITTKNKK